MVSLSKLLQVLSRRLEVIQPHFTVSQAFNTMRCVSGIPLKGRNHSDTLCMLNIFLRCPHATAVFRSNKNICEKVLVSISVDCYFENVELHEPTCKVIRALSVNESLHTNAMVSMARKLAAHNHSPWKVFFDVDTYSAAMSAGDNNDILTDNLLRRVVKSLPSKGEFIRDGKLEFAVLSQKAMHKRREAPFERPELIFLISNLRHITVSRSLRILDGYIEGLRGGGFVQRLLPLFLPADVVEPLTRCVETLPAFMSEDAPMRADEWFMLAYLVGSCDPRLNSLGVRLWKKKSHLLDPKMSVSDASEGHSFPVVLAGLLVAIHGPLKREAMKLWIDIITDSEEIPLLREKVLQRLLQNLCYCISLTKEDNETRERLLAAGKRILQSLGASAPLIVNVGARLTMTSALPILTTPEELQKTFKALSDLLVSEKDLDRKVLHDAAEFLRHVRDANAVDKKLRLQTLSLLVKRALPVAQSVDQCGNYFSVMLPILVCSVATLRSVQASESPVLENNATRETLVQLVDDTLQRQDTQNNMPAIVALLQLMELLDLTTDTRYTTSVREVVCAGFRSVSVNAQEIKPNTAQYCYELLIRTTRFHVLDDELISIAMVALRYAADVAVVLPRMTWAQSASLLERGSLLYRELAHSLNSSRYSRRLLKQVLSTAAAVVMDKPTSSASPRRDLPGTPVENEDHISKRRCACWAWALASRAVLLPIPNTPIDRYLAIILRFVKKSWVFRDVRASHGAPEPVAAADAEAVQPQAIQVNEELCTEMLEGLVPSFNQIVAMAFTKRTAFQANLRRHKAVISTACSVLHQNSSGLSPRVWLEAHRSLSCLPVALAGHCTPMQQAVIKQMLRCTLRAVRACDNHRNRHVSDGQRTAVQENGENGEPVLGPRSIADMFSCAELIEDAELEVYLIELAIKELNGLDTSEFTEEGADLEPREKQLNSLLNTIVSALRRGVVLYY
ncbi:hypothetical protein ERJ75_000038200 [Trypanosoma vivax]|uniref:Uncharacterized protein n=1 Tax=Trypanosoma vivax (strain Y486) TaxID=1055687 RepID=G0U7L4_TRYVY|nr:hypothetical protein TRVL_01466 [Trypanosoma vivax]KAH8620723.1 hypothetical protein ERJ75_000038200 [Trypanosoma vivax]CCC51872.1 conserved hypothetical protein [Trypanosoma vivax Y486]